MRPNPIEVSENRQINYPDAKRVNCVRYEGCLDAAIEKKWSGFTCEQCPVHEDLTVEERERDRKALRAAFDAIMV